MNHTDQLTTSHIQKNACCEASSSSSLYLVSKLWLGGRRESNSKLH